MALYRIPHNTGKVRVVMYLGGAYAVWNGKTDKKHEFRILCRTKKVAEEVARKINAKDHNGEIEVLNG